MTGSPANGGKVWGSDRAYGVGGGRVRIGWIGTPRTGWVPEPPSAVCHSAASTVRPDDPWPKAQRFTQPGVMLRRAELDAVLVVGPPAGGGDATALLEACLRRRLHVAADLSALPRGPGASVAVRALAESADTVGVRFHVLVPARFFPGLGDAPPRGPGQTVTVTLPRPLPQAPPAERLAALDLLTFLGGPVRGMAAVSTSSDGPGSAAVLLRFEPGGAGMLLGAPAPAAGPGAPGTVAVEVRRGETAFRAEVDDRAAAEGVSVFLKAIADDYDSARAVLVHDLPPTFALAERLGWMAELAGG
jgi:hypothetical protein